MLECTDAMQPKALQIPGLEVLHGKSRNDLANLNGFTVWKHVIINNRSDFTARLICARNVEGLH